MRLRGRPKISESDRAIKRIEIRLTEDELIFIDMLAEKEELSRTDLIKRSIYYYAEQCE